MTGGSDFAITNGGGIRGSLPAGAVTTGDLVQTLSFVNNQLVVVENVTSSIIREVLANSISNLNDPAVLSDPDGRFVQISGFRYEWSFDLAGSPEVRLVEVPTGGGDGMYEDLAGVNDGTTFSLACSSYVASGGDGYSMLAGLPRRAVGLRTYESVAGYFAARGSDSAAPISVPIGVPGASSGGDELALRIRQQPAVVKLELGVMCRAPLAGATGNAFAAAHPQMQWTTLDRENCDHVHHTVKLINEKNNGFFDGILPNTKIIVKEATVGCNDGLAFDALRNLSASLPDMLAMVGPICSDDANDLSSAAWRNNSKPGSDAVIISSESTAPALADEELYPKLARMIPNDTLTGVATDALAADLGWKHVAVLSESSAWGTGIARVFMESVQASGGTVINEGNTTFSRAAFNPDEELARLENVDAHIIFLAMDAEYQRGLFARVYESNRLYGAGYAWLTALPTADIYYNTDGSPNASAALGAWGLLGFIVSAKINPEPTSYNQNQQVYLDSWGKLADEVACTGTVDHGTTPYCDANGAPDLPEYTAFHADAVVAFALAMHALFQEGGRADDGDALYARLVGGLPAHEGGAVSDSHIELEATTGDRLAGLDLQNLVFRRAEQRQRGAARRRLASASAILLDRSEVEKEDVFTGADPVFDTVGSFEAGEVIASIGGLFFSGGFSEVPIDPRDQTPAPTTQSLVLTDSPTNQPDDSSRYIWGGIVCCALLALLYACAKKQEGKKEKKKAEREKDEMKRRYSKEIKEKDEEYEKFKREVEAKEAAKDPIIAIKNHQPFAMDRFDAMWTDLDEVKRTKFRSEVFNNIMEMCKTWAFKIDDDSDEVGASPSAHDDSDITPRRVSRRTSRSLQITNEAMTKWDYVNKHIIPLTRVWKDEHSTCNGKDCTHPHRFRKLQEIAEESQKKTAEEVQPIIAKLANATNEAKQEIAAAKWLFTESEEPGSFLKDKGSDQELARSGRGENGASLACWLPQRWLDAVEATPVQERALYDFKVLPSQVLHLARSSFDDFRAALHKALPNAEVEPDEIAPFERIRRALRKKGLSATDYFHEVDTSGDNRIDADELREELKSLFKRTATSAPPDSKEVFAAFDQNADGSIDLAEFVRVLEEEGTEPVETDAESTTSIRCFRMKSVKGWERMVHKIKETADEVAQDQRIGAWPFTSTIGDALRASVTVPDVAEMKHAFDCINANFRIVRIKNKFHQAIMDLERDENGDVTAELKQGCEKMTFPNIHLNVLFQAEGCAPILAEIQIHHDEVQALPVNVLQSTFSD